MEFLSVEEVEEDPVKKSETELVERKGIGHPDSISDGIAEAVSRELSREYRDRFGHVLHHNTDEVQLVAGSSEPEFGGGEVIDPIFIMLTGRATRQFSGEKIPVDRIAMDAAKNYIRENFKALSPEQVEFESRIGETSTDLKTVFESEVRSSNDTSFGVGHYPLTPTERTVRELEHELHQEMPEVGEDVKVMGLRRGETLKLTVAAALISGEVGDMEHYFRVKQEIERKAEKFAGKTGLETEVDVNTADIEEEGSVYLTVTGTSAEMGDDGSVGRGNRVNGLITPHRSMSLEAASGKNPVTHVGKIYNVLADRIARDIHSETGEYAEVKLLSQIGSPIDQPKAVEVESSAPRKVVEDVVRGNLEEIESITDSLVKGEESTF